MFLGFGIFLFLDELNSFCQCYFQRIYCLRKRGIHSVVVHIRSVASGSYGYCLAFIFAQGAGKLEQFQSFFQCYCLNGHIFLELGEAWLFVVSGSTDLYNGTETADFYGYLFAAARFFA